MAPGNCRLGDDVPVMSETPAPPGPGAPLVLGLDVGGTSTRCLVADLRGRRVGCGQSGGANPHGVGMAVAVARIGEAVAGALAGVDPGRVVASVMGAAGFAAYASLDGPFARMWGATGLQGRPRVVGDALVGFCAGTSARDGTVVISGTGAGAVQVSDLEQSLVGDSLGWLLGDDGSGQWVGREAVRHLLAPRPGHGGELPDDPLSRAVRLAVVGRPTGSRDDLIRILYAGPPLALSALAPLVVGLAREGDADAVAVVLGAVDRLERSVQQVRPAGDDTPLVLTGGLFASELLLEQLTARLVARWPLASVVRSGSGAGGAAWLAAHEPAARQAAARPSSLPVGGSGPDVVPPPDRHTALTRLPLAIDP